MLGSILKNSGLSQLYLECGSKGLPYEGPLQDVTRFSSNLIRFQILISGQLEGNDYDQQTMGG